MGEGAEREVLIRIRTVADATNGSALRGVAESVRKAQATSAEAYTKTTKTAEQAAKATEREWKRANDEMLRHETRTFNARMKIIKDRERAEVQAAKTAEKAAKDAAREQEKAAKAVESAQNKVREAHGRTLEAMKMSFEGMAAVGRGFAMLGIVGEKDTEKLLRGLIKIQAVFDLMRGSITIIQAMTKAWQGYRTAVAGAAVAQAAMSMTGGAGGAAGGLGAMAGRAGLGLLGGAASTVGLGVAATVSAGLGANAIVDQFRGNPVGGWNNMMGGFYHKVGAWGMRSHSSETLAGSDGGATVEYVLSQRRVDAMMAQRKLRADVAERREAVAGPTWDGDAGVRALQNAAGLEEARRAIPESTGYGSFRRDQGDRVARGTETRGLEQLGVAAGQYGKAWGDNASTNTDRLRSGQEYLSLLQRQKELVEQTASKERASGAARVQSALQELQIIQQRSDVAKQALRDAQARKAGADTNIGMMSPEQRAQYFAAIGAVRGGTASTEQLRDVSAGPLAHEAHLAQVQAERAGRTAREAAGVGTFREDRQIGEAKRNIEGAQRFETSVRGVTGETKRYNIETTAKMQINYEMDEAKLAGEFKKAIAPINAAIDTVARRIFDEEFNLKMGELASKRGDAANPN